MSETTNNDTAELFSALSKAQGEFPPITLDADVTVKMSSGGSYKFRYATLSHILATVRPVLAKHGLAVSQLLCEGGLKTVIAHSSGQHIAAVTSLAVKDGMKMQEIGSVISYMRRYAITSALGIVGEEDDDANTADGNHAVRKDKGPAKEDNLDMTPAKPKPEKNDNAKLGLPSSREMAASPPNRVKLGVKERKLLFARLSASGIGDDGFRAYMKEEYNVEHTTDLFSDQLDDILKWIEKNKQAKT